MAEKPEQSTPGNLTGKGAFKPGDDPRRNPTGRPPKVLCTPESVRELALAATEDSVVLLHEIVNSPNEHVQNRIQAARSLLALGGANFPKISLQTVQHQIGGQNFDALMQQATALLAGRRPPPNNPGSLLADSLDAGPGPVIDVTPTPEPEVQDAAPAAAVDPAPVEVATPAPTLTLVHPAPAPADRASPEPVFAVPSAALDAPSSPVATPEPTPDPELLALLMAATSDEAPAPGEPGPGEPGPKDREPGPE